MTDSDRDPLIESLLDEWLSGRKPRSISIDRIQPKAIDPHRVAELDQALRNAAMDVRRASSTVVGRPKKSAGTRGRMIAPWLAMAASLLLLLGGWSLYRNPTALTSWSIPSPPTVPPEKAPTQPAGPSVASLPEQGSDRSKTGTPEKGVAVSPKKAAERESLSMENVPFAPSASSQSQIARSPSNDVAHRLSEQEIVAVVDQQLVHMWNAYGTPPSAPISGEQWVERLYERLLGRDIKPEEKDKFLATKDTPANRQLWIRQLVDGPEFTRIWARRLAAYALGENELTSAVVTDERREFVRWLQKELQQSKGLDAIVQRILLPDSTDAKVGSFSPSHYWWTQVTKRSEHAPADVLDSRFLGNRTACSRCHDASHVAGADQNQYWGVAAIAGGVDVEFNDERTAAKVRYRIQEPKLFFERGDATMVAAMPILPDGTPLQTPRGSGNQVSEKAKQNLHAFSEWLVDSPEFAKTQANFVWQSLVGQPLEATYPVDDSEAKQELSDLAALLSQQLRANDYDLRSLVIWIASSKAFQTQTSRRDENWFLTAGDKELATHRQRQRLFASFTPHEDRSIRGVVSLAKWMETASPSGAPNEVLGNLGPRNLLPKEKTGSSGNQGKNAPNNPLRPKLTANQVDLLVRTHVLPQSLESELDRLLQSKLSWEQMVEHVFYMTGTDEPVYSDLEASRRVLTMTRDKKQALTRILSSRLP